MDIPNSKPINYHMTVYTLEQKIVAAVWHHERLFTGMSYEQLQQNFLIRFNTKYPAYSTLKKWEQQLFGRGFMPKKPNKSNSKCSLDRLLHVPYVKESLVRYPDISLTERADILGMPKGTLYDILKNDLANISKVNKHKTNADNPKDTPVEVNIKNEIVYIKSEINTAD